MAFLFVTQEIRVYVNKSLPVGDLCRWGVVEVAGRQVKEVGAWFLPLPEKAKKLYPAIFVPGCLSFPTLCSTHWSL